MVDNLEELIEKAFLLNKTEFSHTQILEKLSSSILVEQTLGLLKLNKLKSIEETLILASMLNHPHSRLRDMASEVILDFISEKEFLPLFENNEFYKIAINSASDINPNVCRNIILVLGCLTNKMLIYDELQKNINLIIKNLGNESNYGKTPDYDKLVFQLFWNLKSIHYLLKNYAFEYDLTLLIETLKWTSNFADYTVREQSAYVVSVVNSNIAEIQILRNKLRDDSNFYVKSAANSGKV